MYRVNILRVTVKADEAERFEEEARKEIKIVTEREPGTVLYCLNRRAGPPSTILPGVPAGHVEYINLAAYNTEAAQEAHTKNERDPDQAWVWTSVWQSFAAGPVYIERYEADEITTGITRAHSWEPGTMFRFAFHRFKILEGQGEEFEEQAKRQLALVRENEPGTVLYSFMRRSPDGSGLLPKNSAGHPEYLHFMAYVDEAAAQLHRQIEHDPAREWAWGPTFRRYLEAPLENEGFLSDQIITGNTKDCWWED